MTARKRTLLSRLRRRRPAEGPSFDEIAACCDKLMEATRAAVDATLRGRVERITGKTLPPPDDDAEPLLADAPPVDLRAEVRISRPPPQCGPPDAESAALVPAKAALESNGFQDQKQSWRYNRKITLCNRVDPRIAALRPRGRR